jgi:hypothetical protein
MKFVIFGMGSGEASQGYAMSNYLTKRGHQVIFALRYDETLPFYPSHSGLTSTVTPSVESLQELVCSTQPDAVILCNSKSFNVDTSFVEQCPWPSISTFSLDSNWLFESEGSTRCIQWLDRYFVIFPETFFRLGLREHGGIYSIPSSMLSRIKAVGFIPSYQKPDEQTRAAIRRRLGIQTHEKFIFCYISGYGAKNQVFVLDNLLHVVRELHRKGQAVKAVVCGKLDLVQHLLAPHIDWLLPQQTLGGLEFFLHLASADLVFQHQGLATLAQAISAQVPVIMNVEVYSKHPHLQNDILEIMPSQRAGLCQFLYEHSPHEKIQQAVETLLYQKDIIGKMQILQKNHYSCGESVICDEMEKYLLSYERS